MARALLLIDGLVIVGLAIAWLATGRKAYLQWSVRVLLASLAVGVVFFVALFISRL